MENAPISNNSGDRRLALSFSLAGAIIIVLHFLFTFVFPGHLKPDFIFSRTWGFHFPAYYPPGWRIFFYSLAVVSLFPPVSTFAARTGRLIYARLSRIGRKQTLFFATAVLSIPVFIALRCKYGLLGDNFVRATDIVRNNFIWHDSGTIFLLHYFYVVMHALLGFDGAQSLASANVLCGAVYVFVSLQIADTLGETPFRKAAFFAAMATSGIMQLFFGYLEITPPAYMLLTVQLYAAIRYSKGTCSAFWPALALACAAGLCLVGLFFAPAFFIIVWSKEAARRPILKKPWFIVLSFAALLGLAWYPLTRWIIPDCFTISPDRDHAMTLFSAAHFWEYWNGVALALGAGAIVFPVLLIYAFSRPMKFDLMSAFLTMGFASVGLGLFVFNEILGSADADIFAVYGIIGPPAFMYVFLRLFDKENMSASARHGVFTFSVLMLLHTGLVVGINASNKSISRIKDIVLPDPGSFYIHHKAPMVLGFIFNYNGLKQESNEMFAKSYEVDAADARNACNYIAVLIRNREFAKALPIAENLVARNPDFYTGLRNLFHVAQGIGNDSLAFRTLQQMYRSYLDHPDMALRSQGPLAISEDLSTLIQCLIQVKRLNDADTVCRVLQDVCPDREFSGYLRASIRYQLGDYDGCLALCRPLMEGKQRNHLIYLTAAQAYEKKHDKSSARAVLERGMQLMATSSGRAALKAELDRLTSGR